MGWKLINLALDTLRVKSVSSTWELCSRHVHTRDLDQESFASKVSLKPWERGHPGSVYRVTRTMLKDGTLH